MPAIGRRGTGEEGIIILLLVVKLALVSLVAALFTHAARIEILGRGHQLDRARAQLAARSGVDVAIRALIDDVTRAEVALAREIDSPRDGWAVLGHEPIPLPGSGELRLEVQDAGRRINLNGLIDREGDALGPSRAFLKDALERIIELMPGRAEDKLYRPEDLADAVLDWLDSDDQTRLGDDEQDYYVRRLGAAWGPVNRPLWSIGELAAIPDVDGALIESLDLYFTTHPLLPEGGGINPNTAPPHVLALLYRGTADDLRLLPERDLFEILRARDEGRIFCTVDDEECESIDSEIGRVGETTFPPLAYTSDVFTVRSEARFDESRACVTTVVDRSDVGEVRTLAFRTGC